MHRSVSMQVKLYQNRGKSQSCINALPYNSSLENLVGALVVFLFKLLSFPTPGGAQRRATTEQGQPYAIGRAGNSSNVF